MEVLNDNIKYKSETNSALEEFKKINPFIGTNKQRREKIRNLNKKLSEIYNVRTPLVLFSPQLATSCYIPKLNVILLVNLSVITFLHEFGHVLGKNEYQTCSWSINLFRKHFKEIYDKLEHKGHLLVNPKDNNLKYDVATGISLFVIFVFLFYGIVLR